MTNAKRKRVSIVSIMRSRAFLDGVADARARKPLDPAYIDGDPVKCWRYEYGRQFGVMTSCEVKSGRVVREEAGNQFVALVQDGSILAGRRARAA